MKPSNGDRIRPASAEDILAFYGRRLPWRARALAVTDAASRLIGLGGFSLQPHGLTVFMDVATGVDPARHKRVLIRAGRQVMQTARAMDRPVLACREADWPASANLLAHFGFEKISGEGAGEMWALNTAIEPFGGLERPGEGGTGERAWAIR